MSDLPSTPDQAAGFTVTGSIAAGRGAVSGIAVSADGSLLTVTHHGDDSISLIDVARGRAGLTVTDVDEPSAVAMSGARAYVSSVAAAYDEILAIDTYSERIVAAHPVGFGVTDVAVSPDGRSVYVARSDVDGAEITVLDAGTGKGRGVRIDATTVDCVRVSPDGQRLYAAANGPSTAALVTIDIRRNRVVATLDIGSPIRDIALSPDGATGYVGSWSPDYGAVLDIVDTRRSVIDATYKIGDAIGTLAQLTLSRNGERAYLIGDQDVTVWSTVTRDVLGTITVGEQPSGAVESPDGTRLYLADYAGGITELEISASAMVDSMAQGEEWTAPHGWAFSDLLVPEPTPA